MTTERKKESLKSMMESCYVYGSAERGSYNFEEYIKSRMDEIGYPEADEIYEAHLDDLKNNDEYEIKYSVYEDSEGVIYNSLTKKV